MIEAVKQRPGPGRGGAAQVGAEIATVAPAGATADLTTGVPMNISVNIRVGHMPVRVAVRVDDGPTDAPEGGRTGNGTLPSGPSTRLVQPCWNMSAGSGLSNW
nr:hypothetical protein KPHV_70420 [Kitasatospora purpeofusca]